MVSPIKVGNGENFKNLCCRHARVVALAQVIAHAIIAAQHHRTGKPYQLFGFGIYRPGGKSMGVRVEEPLEYRVVFFSKFVIQNQYLLVHPGPVIVKVFYQSHLFYFACFKDSCK